VKHCTDFCADSQITRC